MLSCILTWSRGLFLGSARASRAGFGASPIVLSSAGLLCSNSVKPLAALIVLGFLSCTTRLEAAAPINADATLRTVGRFALGGTGYAGTMSEGERALRTILTHSDAIARLTSALPEASPAGQLYALLGLRARDRDAYKQALAKYGQRRVTVETMSGCIVQRESFRDLAEQIDHGDYDSPLARQWPDPVR
jgi:hypothetical protein